MGDADDVTRFPTVHLPQLYCHGSFDGYVCGEERRLSIIAPRNLRRIVGLALIDYLLTSRHIGRELVTMEVKRERVDASSLSSTAQHSGFTRSLIGHYGR